MSIKQFTFGNGKLIIEYAYSVQIAARVIRGLQFAEPNGVSVFDRYTGYSEAAHTYTSGDGNRKDS
ncbi:hypothetical protein [Ethanoligenens sp.]|uniref:hypothetical protein n=1 Tax=Ethanoligenens sp. TaxID=2099655 RepID=UPI0039EA1D0A